MSKQIHISQISAEIKTKIDITTTNKITVSFQLDAKIQTTESVTYTEQKPIIWSNILKMPYGNDQSLDIKLYNDKVILAKGVLIVPSTLQEQKNTLEIHSENKQLIAKVSFKTNIQEISSSPKKVQEPEVKTKTQKTIPLQESPQKSQQSPQKNQQQSPEKSQKSPQKIQQSPQKSQKQIKEDKKQIKDEKKQKKDEKKQQPEPLQNKLSNSVRQPSQKSIHQSQKIKEQHQQEQTISPKKSEIKLSDRPARKITQKSQKRPEEKTIQNQKPQRVQIQSSNFQDSSLMGTQSLNKSRDTLKLPNIGDISKNFGDKIFDKQSSATLQKSILSFSVPKAPRFGSGPKYAGEPSYYVDTCFKPNSSKGVGFGFGNKRQFPQWMQKNMKQNPAPGAYFYQNKPSNSMQKKGNLTSHLHTRGPSFGISYKFYEKVTIPKEKSPQRTTVSNQRLKPIFRSN